MRLMRFVCWIPDIILAEPMHFEWDLIKRDAMLEESRDFIISNMKSDLLSCSIVLQ